MRKKWFWVILMWLMVFVVAVGNWDPDFGWHVRTGEVIVKSGIPLTDPFSYTMSTFPVVAHEWLVDVGIGVIMNNFGASGYVVLAIIAATIVALTLWLMVGNDEENIGIPMVFGIMAWVGRAGIRPQILDWLFFAILIRLFFDAAVWRKWRWVWPVIMVVWVNLHAGFAVGIAALGVMMGFRWLQERRIDVGDLVTMALTIVATMINPFGTGIWWEIWLTMSDSSLKWTISEWVPFFVTFEMTFWLMVTLCVFLLKMYWRKIAWWQIAVFGGVVVASMLSVRHVGIAFVVVVPMTMELLRAIKSDLVKDGEQLRRWKILYRLLICVGLALTLWTGFWTCWGVLQGNLREDFYPVKAVQYLVNNPVRANLFSEYGWGGYLIWKLPEYKLFIDGRMPSWRYNSKECVESCWAMKDYGKARGGDYKELFGKYEVNSVLLAKVADKRIIKIERLDKFFGWLEKLVGGKKQENKDLVLELKHDGWEVVYEDRVAIVLERR